MGHQVTVTGHGHGTRYRVLRVCIDLRVCRPGVLGYRGAQRVCICFSSSLPTVPLSSAIKFSAPHALSGTRVLAYPGTRVPDAGVPGYPGTGTNQKKLVVGIYVVIIKQRDTGKLLHKRTRHSRWRSGCKIKKPWTCTKLL